MTIRDITIMFIVFAGALWAQNIVKSRLINQIRNESALQIEQISVDVQDFSKKMVLLDTSQRLRPQNLSGSVRELREYKAVHGIYPNFGVLGKDSEEGKFADVDGSPYLLKKSLVLHSAGEDGKLCTDDDYIIDMESPLVREWMIKMKNSLKGQRYEDYMEEVRKNVKTNNPDTTESY